MSVVLRLRKPAQRHLNKKNLFHRSLKFSVPYYNRKIGKDKFSPDQISFQKNS